MNQSTGTDLRFEGIGLHSGLHCAVEIRQAPPGHGIVFVRRDLVGASLIPATVHYVVSSERCTTLGIEGRDTSIATTEHLLAALTGLGHWDALIEVNGPELPILDGSAGPYSRALSSWPILEQPEQLVLDEVIEVQMGSSRALAMPSNALSIRCKVVFAHQAIGAQEAFWDGEVSSFRKKLARARTFGFLEEVDELRRRGIALGGSLEGALVYGPEGPLNAPRFPDEPARHKLVDAMGDLALLGRPLRAALHLERPGHTLMVELAKRLSIVVR